MMGYEKLLAEKPADLCLVVGDITSTMACAIVAKKAHMQAAHERQAYVVATFPCPKR